MIYAFMVADADEFRIERMCRVLGVGRSGYYAWRSRSPSQRTNGDEVLLTKIQQRSIGSVEGPLAARGSMRLCISKA